MRAVVLLLFVAGVSASACRKPRAADPSCGMKLDDWCESPAGDPCGAHRDEASCRADPRCEGMLYRGESFVACEQDARCFGSNCPTVGCLSRCEALDEASCRAQSERCALRADRSCARRLACGPAPVASSAVPACASDADCIARNCECRCTAALVGAPPCQVTKCVLDPCAAVVARCDSASHACVLSPCGGDAGKPCPR